MTRPPPEEIARLKAVKAAKKAEKKARFGEHNERANLPVIEVRVPMTHEHNGKVYEIDMERPPWNDLVEAYERHWRIDGGKGPCRHRIIRT